mmetsp:Transcript_22013/g.25451  ORF Transcript_22013/g.25451 Transcript_22013/m.25451 type:complete len:87 (+) Transcript_22013:731-991(+)
MKGFQILMLVILLHLQKMKQLYLLLGILNSFVTMENVLGSTKTSMMIYVLRYRNPLNNEYGGNIVLSLGLYSSRNTYEEQILAYLK